MCLSAYERLYPSNIGSLHLHLYPMGANHSPKLSTPFDGTEGHGTLQKRLKLRDANLFWSDMPNLSRWYGWRTINALQSLFPCHLYSEEFKSVCEMPKMSSRSFVNRFDMGREIRLRDRFRSKFICQIAIIKIIVSIVVIIIMIIIMMIISLIEKSIKHL